MRQTMANRSQAPVILALVILTLGTLALLAALPARADDNANPADVATLRACEDRGGETCSGTVSAACQETTEGGQTTVGIVDCAFREMRAWDVLLNEELQAMVDMARAADELEAGIFPEHAHFEDALRGAQDAWRAFRDAECGLAYASWGSGSMRHIAGANCILEMTAERTRTLRDMRESY